MQGRETVTANGCTQCANQVGWGTGGGWEPEWGTDNLRKSRDCRPHHQSCAEFLKACVRPANPQRPRLTGSLDVLAF
jgi:hypothetical protein